VPDKIIGYSIGELGCAYADGCITAEQMILFAYSRGLESIETKVNNADNSTISGPAESMMEFFAQLQVSSNTHITFLSRESSKL